MRADASQSGLEAAILPLLDPVEGQYPRPWLTDAPDPATARVFIVGRNQAKAFPADAVASKADFVDALFNRGGETCRAMYDRLSPTPSPTRRNLDRLAFALANAGVSDVIQTNVVCFSTPLSRVLTAHAAGRDAGRRIFRTLMRHGRAEVLILHGEGTVGEFRTPSGGDCPRCPGRRRSCAKRWWRRRGRPKLS